MERIDADRAVQQLITGFETLQEEYRALHGQHQALERKLATAREQYNELAKICGTGATSTPPLSLASSPGRPHEVFPTQTTLQILRTSDRQEAAIKVEAAIRAASTMRNGMPNRPDLGVRIWSGPSADRQEGGNFALHSISESPLEQDFTVEGKPSQLGCPFASMAGKKLSSHAASVLSRYKTGSTGASGSQLGSDSVNRVNGKESLSRRGSRRASFVDPIKAEICGLSDHQDAAEQTAELVRQPTAESQEEPGVCPIRFLDQHSPEEVATYFEKHKHELPRSHEFCVKRYQSNEQQIRELDEKYGNLVSMIQGLGKKHKGMLPPEPEDEEDVNEDNVLDQKDAEKVRKWASSVSAQVGDKDAAIEDGEDEGEERQQHFERPLRDIRVGESPSRPWGISVPPRYLEKKGSDVSSRPAQVTSPPVQSATNTQRAVEGAKGRCPFGFDQIESKPTAKAPRPEPASVSKHVADPHAGKAADSNQADGQFSKSKSQRPEPAPAAVNETSEAARPTAVPLQTQNAVPASPRMIFNGPVFFGCSAEDASKILRQAGFGNAGG